MSISRRRHLRPIKLSNQLHPSHNHRTQKRRPRPTSPQQISIPTSRLPSHRPMLTTRTLHTNHKPIRTTQPQRLHMRLHSQKTLRRRRHTSSLHQHTSLRSQPHLKTSRPTSLSSQQIDTTAHTITRPHQNHHNKTYTTSPQHHPRSHEDTPPIAAIPSRPVPSPTQ